VPIIGLERHHESLADTLHEDDGLASRHSLRLLQAISKQLGVPIDSIVDFDLELFDFHKATTLGLSGELIAGPRLDDKLCSFAALWSLINIARDTNYCDQSGSVQMIGLFDNEEIGSRLPQGAKGNFMQTVVERIVECQLDTKLASSSPFTFVREHTWILCFP
jgi:aminopeptidase I